MIIGSKANEPYLFNINKIKCKFSLVIAIIRNPIYTIASWRSWYVNGNKELSPVARVKKGEEVFRYKNFPFKSDITVERQAEIWNYLASIIWNNKKYLKIYRYEDLTENTTEVMDDIASYLCVKPNNEYKDLKNMNIDSRYQDLDKIKRAVQKYAPISKKFGYK